MELEIWVQGPSNNSAVNSPPETLLLYVRDNKAFRQGGSVLVLPGDNLPETPQTTLALTKDLEIQAH